MKKTVLTLMAVLSAGAHAATFNGTVNPNPIVTSAAFSNKPVNGLFEDAWTFTVGANIGGSSSITNISFQDINIENLAATIDGSDAFFKEITHPSINVLAINFPSLAIGDHTLAVTGISHDGSYGGNLNIAQAGGNNNGDIAKTPLPGAFWLFGVALSGLVGWRRSA